MDSSIRQDRTFRLRGRTIVGALVLASLIGGLSISPALADNGHGRGHGNHSHREFRGGHDDYDYRHDYRRPYHYAQPVYVPAPVYYEPRQSPGIGLFFPLDLRR